MAAAIVLGLLSAAGRADEIDDLAAQIKPEPRFKDYQPNFRAETRRFTFHQARGQVEEPEWRLIRDGEKYVALVRSGDILLLARTPDAASADLAMPTGRYHLDTLQGPSLPTWQFIQQEKDYVVYGEGGTDTFEGGGRSITLVRRQSADDREVHHRFVLTVDPVFGYRIDGHYHAALRELPQGKQRVFGSGTFCPGCYTPWAETAVFDRTVYTPAHATGCVGYANNLLAMDRCDGNRARFTWRDKGFIAYLDPRSGWSVVRTRDDGLGVPTMSLCNAHNDFHISIPIPEDLTPEADGRYHVRAHHRLMALPPELTRHLWDHMTMQDVGKDGVFVRVGRVEDFEDQPISLALPTRGLTWTSGGPRIATDQARSGAKSLLLTGTSWPNLPQVSLKPQTTYVLEAWFKVEGQSGTRAYIKGDYYEWSPHQREWLLQQQTSDVKAGEGWKRAALQFTTPEWDPFINIVFVLEGEGKAYMDDFRLAPVEPGKP
jgi:hypothetical protein